MCRVASAFGGARDGDASIFKDAIILSAMTAPRRTSPYLLLTLTPFFWACNWIIGRALHADIPPMAMTFFRWLFAILILAPFAWPHLSATGPWCAPTGRC